MNTMGAPSHQVLGDIALAPEDGLYALMRRYRQDTNENKIDLGIGAYRDENGKPWILPVVKKAEAILQENPEFNHEYLPIQGLDTFLSGAKRLLLGEKCAAVEENRICSIQTVSGTGAVHLGATFLSRFVRQKPPRVYISDPTWPNHQQIFGQLQFDVQYYPYYQHSQAVDIEGMLGCLRAAPAGSIIVLQACAHNPTGMDLSHDEWKRVAAVMKDCHLFPFFDCAYQGFASGDLEKDSWAVRYFVELGFECCIAQSFAKNLGLYGERVGAYHFICGPGAEAPSRVNILSSHIALISRAEISNPPAYGARIASTVMNNGALFSEWEGNLETMSGRLREMRRRVLAGLRHHGQEWDVLSTQIGMFSFIPLTKSQISKLRDEWHIYMTENGRISVAGLNTKNIDYFIKAVDAVISSNH